MRGGKGRRGSSVRGNHEVGYARPPVHSRFKKGQSGNPKGRPRGRRSVAAILHKILGEKVSVREGERVWLISKTEAIVRSLSLKALRGDQKATETVLALAQEHVQSEDRPGNGAITIEFVSPDESRWGPRPPQGNQATGDRQPVRSVSKT
jgi:Family of unknown function (DUF5681)